MCTYYKDIFSCMLFFILMCIQPIKFTKATNYVDVNSVWSFEYLFRTWKQ